MGIFRGGAVGLAACVFAGAASARGLDELQAQARAQQWPAVYELAEGMRGEWAGDPQFDSVYGLAAFHTRHYNQAVFAFERVVLARPDDPRARLELGRALFASGNYLQAREQFQRVLTQNPPQRVRENVQAFLEAIEQRLDSTRTNIGGYLQAGAGYDTNINSATFNEEVIIPIFGRVTLEDGALETESGFTELEAGLVGTQPLSKNSSVFVQGAYQKRHNFETSLYDLDILSLSAGYLRLSGANRWRFPIQLQQLYVDSEKTRTLGTVGAEWARYLTPRQELAAFVQYGRSDYPDLPSRDAALWTGGLSWSLRSTVEGLVYNASLYYGDERAEDADFQNNGRDYWGLQAGADWQFHPAHSVYASLTWQDIGHDAQDPLFGVVREDEFGQLLVGWGWDLTPAWQLRSEVSVIENDSTLPIYEYERRQASVALRYSFD